MRNSKKLPFIKVILSFSVLVSVGCMTKTPREDKEANRIKQVQELEDEVKRLAEQNQVLTTKRQVTQKPSHVPNVTASKKQEEPNNEHSLYAAALESYWSKDVLKLKRFTVMMMKTYPNSVHTDNALYLLATLQKSSLQYGECLQTLNIIERRHPLSNKLAATWSLKAEIYDKLNLTEQAQDLRRRIVKTYPGSQEARLLSIGVTK